MGAPKTHGTYGYKKGCRCDICSASTRKQNRRTRERRKAFLESLKLRPCTDCNHNFPYYVMQFDHVRGTKEISFGRANRHFSEEQILLEASKCDVVCANCHAIRGEMRRIYMGGIPYEY